jgi:acetylglutamate kinase
MMTVVKLGGNSMDELPALLKFVAGIEGKVVLVHGGAPQITAMMKRLGLVGTFHQGLRVTDEATLEVTQMVLTGQVNKQIVVAAQQEGLPAVGLSGIDGGMLQADVHLGGELGCVGTVREVKVKLLHTLLEKDFVPVVSPLGLGPQGGVLNINADMSAAAIAAGLNADRLVFLTNVDGLLDDTGSTISNITPRGVQELMDTGVITQGMIPKMESALSALSGGVKQVEIRNAAEGQGTTLCREGANDVETVC